jgi:hypothetical protein
VDAFVRRRRRLLKAPAPEARARHPERSARRFGALALALFVSASAVLAASALSACGGEGAGAGRGAVGVSDKPRPVTSGPLALDAGARDGSAALPASYRETFAKVNRARASSQGHATGRWDLDVYANDAGVQALATRAREAPVGARVVAEHYERAAGMRDRAGPVYVMEKRERGFSPDHGDWRYVVVGSQGQLVNDGVIASCAGCHDGAPMDGLFPILE